MVKSFDYNISDTFIQILVANPSIVYLKIINTGTNVVYLKNTNGVTTDDFPLNSNEEFFCNDYIGDYFAICEIGNVGNIRVEYEVL